MRHFIGQMSGTSLDGIDSVLIQVSPQGLTLVAHHHQSFPDNLKTRLIALCNGTSDELDVSAKAANELSRLYAEGAKALLAQQNLSPYDVTAIGCHGQTIRHMPPHYTVQIVNGALLAELTDIDVVCDFRNRDMAAGGQGAPLVPAFHEALFAQEDMTRVILNIGGMANISVLSDQANVTGHDTGPGNVLMDAWCKQHTGHDYDEDGQWARTGAIDHDLLKSLLDDPYFKLAPPKSTGREHFNLQWLKPFLRSDMTPENVQATLLALTSSSIAQEIKRTCSKGDVIVCGGGAFNSALMESLQDKLEHFVVKPSSALGIDPQWIEAMAFAWLAQQCIERKTGNKSAVTGAKGPRVLGAIYPA